MLAGCAHVHVQSPVVWVTNPTQKQLTTQPSSVVTEPNVCERSLKLANYNLSFAKQQAKRAHVFTDWAPANKALAAATNAYTVKNYNGCVEQAQLVNTYIERNQSYIRWRNSLNL